MSGEPDHDHDLDHSHGHDGDRDAEDENEVPARARHHRLREFRRYLHTKASSTRAGAISEAIAESMDTLDKGVDAAWQSLKNVGEVLRDPRRVGVRAAEQPSTEWLRQLAALLSKVGAEILRSGANTVDVEKQVMDIAARYGVHARCFALPTGILVRVEAAAGDTGGQLDFAPVADGEMQLRQVEAVQRLVGRMRGEAVPFDQVREALRQERDMPRRFHPAAAISGYGLLTLALGMMQHPTLNAALGYLAIGAMVGVLQFLVRRYWPPVLTLLPVLAAIMVTALALRFSGPVLHESPGYLFIPPLIGFLPGAALTLGAIELATDSTLSGLARLAGAVNVLLLLALGILVATDTVHAYRYAGHHPATLGIWVGWLAVVVLAIGFTLNHDAPRRSLLWLILALLVTRAIQTAGTVVGGQALGAFVAGMVLPPTTSWIGKRAQIPDQVIFLPAFWMLVPGSRGLSGVQQLLVARSSAGWQTLLNVVVIVASIALGVLAGASLRRTTRLEVVSGAEEEAETV